jgi:hypothetical protein
MKSPIFFFTNNVEGENKHECFYCIASWEKKIIHVNMIFIFSKMTRKGCSFTYFVRDKKGKKCVKEFENKSRFIFDLKKKKNCTGRCVR